MGLRPSRKGAEDAYVWTPLTTGIYSARSGYNATAQASHCPSAPISQPEAEFNWLKDIWSTKTSPKLKLFLWSTIQGALPLGVELQKRGLNAAALCPRCKEVETAMHTFFLCPFAKEVWNHVPFKTPVHIAEDMDFKSAIVKFRQALCLPPIGVRSPLLPWVCWSLWTARNKLIFEDKTNPPIEIAIRGLAAALEWDQAQAVMISKTNPNIPQRAAPVRLISLDTENPCFVDAAWDSTAKRAGTAWILNKLLPHHARSGSQIFDNVNSPLMAESFALRNGIEELIKAGVQSTTVFSDCQMLIRAIVNKSQIKEVYGVLQDIDRLSSLFVSICFQFIPRSQNRETDFLAKQALQAHCCLIPSV
ncbi:PREDICTED: uncharacterized protein LOC106324301 [Brassica oleracea var. oleracea]|uniref:uncharacterized protein LOC106324301 n=1 Tax=Brassica oleracea var. oleracea TaxID=109376 RepID=UPI0006A6A2A2|nr:PREDICTED: uncharacterized protein LOC106324301 [Brassica oleracea var. oleracea]